MTPNARSYYELLSFISDLLIRNPNPNLRKLLKLKVKVTTEKYTSISAMPWMKIFRLNDGMDPFEAYFKIYLFSKGKKEFKNLLIGIDPGRRMGLAVIGDGEILDLRIFHETREIVEYLRVGRLSEPKALGHLIYALNLLEPEKLEEILGGGGGC